MRLGQAEHALYDANVCRELKPDWSKRCCFREGVALCFLQVKTISLLLQKAVDFERKRSVMSSGLFETLIMFCFFFPIVFQDTVFSFFYREVVDAQKEVSRQGKD